MCTDIVEIWFGIADGPRSSIFYGVICPRQMARYYSLTLLLLVVVVVVVEVVVVVVYRIYSYNFK